MKRIHSSTFNMQLKKGTIDANAMVNKSTPLDQPQHRRYSESELDLKTQENPEEKKQRLYKTEICRNWEEQNTCRYGEKCQYAHGKEELRFVKRHPRYKTIYCQTFETLGTCPYGVRCTFVHESSPHNLQPSLDPVKSDMLANNPTSTSEPTCHPSVSDVQASSSSGPLLSTDHLIWAQSRYITQPATQQVNDDMIPPPSLASTLSPPSIAQSSSLLPRLSISSSSSSSSSSILSASSSTIFSPLSPQNQGNRHLNFYQDYQQNRMGNVDDGYQKQFQHWYHQPYFEHHPPLIHQQQEQAIKTQKYQLPGSRSARDLFTDGDGFHSALGVAPPSATSTVTPSAPSSSSSSSFFARRPPPTLPTCTSSSTSFASQKYHLIN